MARAWARTSGRVHMMATSAKIGRADATEPAVAEHAVGVGGGEERLVTTWSILSEDGQVLHAVPFFLTSLAQQLVLM